jgi:hypothetical protein
MTPSYAVVSFGSLPNYEGLGVRLTIRLYLVSSWRMSGNNNILLCLYLHENTFTRSSAGKSLSLIQYIVSNLVLSPLSSALPV